MFYLRIYRLPIYGMDVIKSFRDAETEKIWNQQFSRRLSGIAKPGLRKLIHLDRATSLNDLAMIPGDRLEPLAGDRKNQYSIRINDQYRVCFVWRQADAYLVEIVDYH